MEILRSTDSFMPLCIHSSSSDLPHHFNLLSKIGHHARVGPSFSSSTLSPSQAQVRACQGYSAVLAPEVYGLWFQTVVHVARVVGKAHRDVHIDGGERCWEGVTVWDGVTEDFTEGNRQLEGVGQEPLEWEAAI